MTLAPASPEAPPVVVTDAAVKRIKFLQDREGKPGAALRLMRHPRFLF